MFLSDWFEVKFEVKPDTVEIDTETTYTSKTRLLATNIKDDDIGGATDVHLNPDVNVSAQQSRAQQTDAKHCNISAAVSSIVVFRKKCS